LPRHVSSVEDKMISHPTASLEAKADIVGRAFERDRLRERIDIVATGRGGAVLIGGEPGIGKTRLAQHALDLALTRGFQIAGGRSDPVSQDVAFGAAIRVIRPILQGLDDRERDRIVRGLDPLGPLLPGLGLGDLDPLDDAALERTRIYEAFLRVVDRLSRDTPLALLFDDLHWADRSTLELLAYIADDLSALPILVVGGYQPGLVAEREPLAGFLAHLRRTLGPDELILRSLDDGELADLAASLLGSRPPAELVDFLSTRANGNPLFTKALIDALIHEGRLAPERDGWVVNGRLDVETPPVIRSVLADVLARLTAEQRRVADVLAVGGDALDRPMIRDVSRMEPQVHLADLERAGVVTANPAPVAGWSLAHPLLRDVTYELLPADARRVLHARFAAAYERLGPNEIDRLAHHAIHGLPETDPTWVLDVATRAGRHALGRAAGSEAATYLGSALGLARQHRPGRVADLLELMAEARVMTGDRDAAVAAITEAIRRPGPASDPAEIARLRLVAARILSDAEFDASDVHVELGRSALRESIASNVELDLELLLVAATNAHRRADSRGVAILTDRIITSGDGLAGDKAQAVVAAARLMAALQRCDYLAAERELVSGGLLRGGLELRIRHISTLGLVAAVKGDLPALRVARAQAVDVARQHGIPVWHIRLSMLGFLDALYSGDWERAAEAIEDVDRFATRLTHPPATALGRALTAILLAYQADFDRSLRILRTEVAADGATRQMAERISTAARAIIELERGDPATAHALLDRIDDTPMNGSNPPWDIVAKGEAAARTGHLDDARFVADRLAAMTGEGTYTAAMASRIRGLASAFDGEVGAASSCLDQSARSFADLGIPFEEARAGVELAELAIRTGGSNERDIGDRLAGWYATFERLGATRYAARARRALQALGRSVVLAARASELTPRQLEIAELVSEGSSNAEIAERLFLSVRTVTSHLDHIYTRLGIGSRAALAAYVVARRSRSDAEGALDLDRS
jgi:DNA-binding CsgD family transcriptional regulator